MADLGVGIVGCGVISGIYLENMPSFAGIKAVAAKDGITAIKIRSGRMLNAYGFMKNIFEIFEYFKTSVDMVTTSEVAVSVTIDNPKHLEEIINEVAAARSTERGTRADDKRSEAAMEDRKKGGYF